VRIDFLLSEKGSEVRVNYFTYVNLLFIVKQITFPLQLLSLDTILLSVSCVSFFVLSFIYYCLLLSF
jgi:hypothetical protein